MNFPAISVVLPVYNGEKFLHKAVQSVLGQSFTDFELIIINDGSTDRTNEVIQSFKDPRIVYIKNEVNKGLVFSLNKGVDLAKGKYIARMDADDISLPERFQKQVHYLQQHDAVMVLATFIELIDDNDKPKGNWPDDRLADSYKKIRSLLPWSNCIAHPTVMLRKELFREFRYNEAQIYLEDWDLWLRMAASGKIIEKIAEPLVQYRIHDQSATVLSNKHNVFLKKHQGYKTYLKSLKKEQKSSPFNRTVRKAYLLNLIKLFLSRIKRAFTS